MGLTVGLKIYFFSWCRAYNKINSWMNIKHATTIWRQANELQFQIYFSFSHLIFHCCCRLMLSFLLFQTLIKIFEILIGVRVFRPQNVYDEYNKESIHLWWRVCSHMKWQFYWNVIGQHGQMTAKRTTIPFVVLWSLVLMMRMRMAMKQFKLETTDELVDRTNDGERPAGCWLTAAWFVCLF